MSNFVEDGQRGRDGGKSTFWFLSNHNNPLQVCIHITKPNTFKMTLVKVKSELSICGRTGYQSSRPQQSTSCRVRTLQ